VLDGSQAAFTTEYRSAESQTDAWLLLTVEQFRTPEGGAVMTHQNVTSRKHAELEAEQRRQELAHVARVSTMGELAASIAHELNQPLTGVLTNAQAALRFLEHDPPNVVEIGEILHDIIDDDRRAGEVIRRLRAMVQTGAIEPADVDLADVVAEVRRLLGSDAVLRNVAIEVEGSNGLPRVRGDHIQLKQVVLNLVVNAMDAMNETEPHERRVTIRTTAADPATVLISVSDRGHGIDENKLGQIFDPFFTTKREGMGMGLSIARTIVEAHGGTLSAVNNPDGGASFLCKLPASTAAEQGSGSI
jgi:C4-dicarboxylate-specific signal transduction histidine kinase